jgi:hypothetical protein
MSRSIASQFAVGIISALGAMFAADPPIALAQGAMAQDSNAGPPNVSVLPYPDPVFKGVIGRTTADSKPDFPQPVKAPEGAPNILVILTDDVGFGASSTFGGPVPTPTLDALAAQGLKYNAFSTTALCSPTRAALITGPSPSVRLESYSRTPSDPIGRYRRR